MRGGTIGSVLLILQPLYIAAEFISVVGVRAQYSLLDSTISAAGAATCTTIVDVTGTVEVCSPWGWVLNSAMVGLGFAVAVGAMLLRPWLPMRRGRNGVVVTAIVSGVSMAATGLVPLDLNMDLHVLVALPQFISFPLMLLLFAIVLRQEAPIAAILSGVAASLCLLGVALFITFLSAPHGGGFFERIALWPWSLALFPVGLTMLQRVQQHR